MEAADSLYFFIICSAEVFPGAIIFSTKKSRYDLDALDSSVCLIMGYLGDQILYSLLPRYSDTPCTPWCRTPCCLSATYHRSISDPSGCDLICISPGRALPPESAQEYPEVVLYKADHLCPPDPYDPYCIFCISHASHPCSFSRWCCDTFSSSGWSRPISSLVTSTSPCRHLTLGIVSSEMVGEEIWVILSYAL